MDLDGLGSIGEGWKDWDRLGCSGIDGDGLRWFGMDRDEMRWIRVV